MEMGSLAGFMDANETQIAYATIVGLGSSTYNKQQRRCCTSYRYHLLTFIAGKPEQAMIVLINTCLFGH